MPYVYRKQIAEAIEKVKQELGPIECVWREELHWEDFDELKSIYVEGVGDIALPLSTKDAKLIVQCSQPVESRTWLIEWRTKVGYNSSLNGFCPKAIQRITGIALNRLKGVNRGDVELHLSHLALHQVAQTSDDIDYDSEAEHYPRMKDMKKGPLATLILQLPTMNQHRGGEFEVKHHDHGRSFKTNNRNHRETFFLTLFSSDSELVRQPVTHGILAELVFYLRLRKNSPIIPDENINSPIFRMWQKPPLKQEVGFRLTRKQAALVTLFENWKHPEHNPIELFAIPLEHQYSKSTISFRALKGMDRQLVSVLQSLLGHFVEFHLAVVTKYIGFDPDDWIAFGNERTGRRTGKHSGNANEKDLTEYFAGSFVDLSDRHLKLPPLAITVPDELVGIDELVFQHHPSDPNRSVGGVYDNLKFDRAALIIWPRIKSLTMALCFGLEAALDVVEQGQQLDAPYNPIESIETQVQSLLEYTVAHPIASWFAHTQPWICSDLRCFKSQPVPFSVASQRSVRLLTLISRWNLRDAGIRLLSILGADIGEGKNECFTCHSCKACSHHFEEEGIVYIGGIHSDKLAELLAEFIVKIGWETPSLPNLVACLFSEVPNQIGPLCHLAVCLHRLQCYDAAYFVCNQACMFLCALRVSRLLKTKSPSTAIASCVKMIIALNGNVKWEQSSNQLSVILHHLKSLGKEFTPHLINCLQQCDPTHFNSLPSYRKFYLELCAYLELHVEDIFPPWQWFYEPSSSSTKMDVAVGLAAAHLMSSFLWLKDPDVVSSFIHRKIQPQPPGRRNMIPFLLSTRHIWASSPSENPTVQDAVRTLVTTRVLQLLRFKNQKECWEQPDAVLVGFPKVETFLRSSTRVMTFSGFADPSDIQTLVAHLTFDADPMCGYSVNVVTCGGSTGNFFVTIAKTAIIAQSLRKELDSLEAELRPVSPDEVSAEVQKSHMSVDRSRSVHLKKNRNLTPGYQVKRSERIRSITQKE